MCPESIPCVPVSPSQRQYRCPFRKDMRGPVWYTHAHTSSVVVSINSIVGGIEVQLITRAMRGVHVEHFVKVLKSSSEWTDQCFPVERECQL